MKFTYGIVALILLWLFLVIRAVPAEWGLWLANPPATFGGVTGTIWSGKVANVVIPYQGSYYALGELSWQTRPWSLLIGRPCAEIETELNSQTINGEVCGSLGGDLRVRNMQINVPAQATELWLPAKVGGEILLRIDELEIDDNRIVAAEGKGSWSNARFHNTQIWLQLGTIGFEFNADQQGGVFVKSFDVDGPLQVDLQSNINTAGEYQTRGDIILRENAQAEIGQLLQHITEPVAANHFKVDWSG